MKDILWSVLTYVVYALLILIVAAIVIGFVFALYALAASCVMYVASTLFGVSLEFWTSVVLVFATSFLLRWVGDCLGLRKPSQQQQKG